MERRPQSTRRRGSDGPRRRHVALALAAGLIAVSVTGCRLGAAPQQRPSPCRSPSPGPAAPPAQQPSAPSPQPAPSPSLQPAPGQPAPPPASTAQPAQPPQVGPRGRIAPVPLAGGSEKLRRPPEDIEISRIYPGLVFRFGSPNRRQVALTFDDAPDDRFTPQILDVLKQQGVRATFFIIGSRAQQYPDVLRRMVQEGHAIGNHTWSHAQLTKLKPDEVAAELAKTEQVLQQTTGISPRLFRPPYGSESPQVLQRIFNLGYRVILWDVDSLDWKSLPTDQVIDNDLNHAHNGAIFLHHAAGGPGEDLSGTVNALPMIIGRLRDKGYQFVTVPELLGIRP